MKLEIKISSLDVNDDFKREGGSLPIGQEIPGQLCPCPTRPNIKSLPLKVMVKVKVDERQRGQKQHAPDNLI